MKYLLLCFCLLTATAHAAKLQQDSTPSAPETVDMPLKGLESSHHMDDNLNSSESAGGALELKASSWQPKQLQLSAYSTNLSDFKNMGVPELGLIYIKPLSERWKLEIGFSLLALSRTGTIAASGQTITLEQDAYIPQLRAGADYFLSAKSKPVRPYLEAAVSPTLILTKRSSVDDGISNFGFTVEAGVGSLVKISNTIDLDINAAETAGNINSSKMQNFAVASGVRINL